MDLTTLIYYVAGGCIVLLILVIVSNVFVNMLIKQFTDRAMHQFQQRLSHEVTKALEAFKEGVCEQMAMQERKSDSLAKLYSSLIDLVREGKKFTASMGKQDTTEAEKKLRTYEDISLSFCEQYQKQNLHFAQDFKTAMDAFVLEQETVRQFLLTQWKTARNEAPEKREVTVEQIRQAWTKAEDRVAAVMDLMRNEFRRRVQAPESIMKKWLTEPPPSEAAGKRAKAAPSSLPA
jgi:hypothetical protein